MLGIETHIPFIRTWQHDSHSFGSLGLYQVGMTGACVLISKPVLEAKVNYDHIYNVSFWGEDRAFCIPCRRTWL